jgi:hypothetical protein
MIQFWKDQIRIHGFHNLLLSNVSEQFINQPSAQGIDIWDSNFERGAQGTPMHKKNWIQGFQKVL